MGRNGTLTAHVVGVLAVQGGFAAHASMLTALGMRVVEVRLPQHLDACEALVLPGGESTTIIRLMQRYGLYDAIITRAHEGMPIFGTCAGLILLSKAVESGAEQGGQTTLGLLDVVVARNHFGRQVDSFESNLDIHGLMEPLKAVFIRAPSIKKVGPGVDVLATIGEDIVMVRSGAIIGAAFHPELSGDSRVHEMFLELISGG